MKDEFGNIWHNREASLSFTLFRQLKFKPWDRYCNVLFYMCKNVPYVSNYDYLYINLKKLKLRQVPDTSSHSMETIFIFKTC